MWGIDGPYVVGFSTRDGGVSSGQYRSLNLGLLTADLPANVEENRRRLCAEAGADPQRLAMNRQVHGARVNRAEPASRSERGDGLWTDEPNVPMLVLTADCLPIAIASTDGRAALALLHVGRVGLLAGVVEAGLRALEAGRTAAFIGPGIGPCCYEVGDDIREAYRARFGERALRGRNLDLWHAAKTALREAGVDTVTSAQTCTACNADRFFSHRRDHGVTGRQGMIAYVT